LQSPGKGSSDTAGGGSAGTDSLGLPITSAN